MDKQKKISKVISIVALIFMAICFSCLNNSTKPSIIQTCQDIEKIDSSLLDITIRSAIKKLTIDTNNILVDEERPGIIDGIKVNFGDTCNATLFVNETSEKNLNYRMILDSQIMGVSWEKKKTNRKNLIIKFCCD